MNKTQTASRMIQVRDIANEHFKEKYADNRFILTDDRIVDLHMNNTLAYASGGNVFVRGSSSVKFPDDCIQVDNMKIISSNLINVLPEIYISYINSMIRNRLEKGYSIAIKHVQSNEGATALIDYIRDATHISIPRSIMRAALGRGKLERDGKFRMDGTKVVVGNRKFDLLGYLLSEYRDEDYLWEGEADNFGTFLPKVVTPIRFRGELIDRGVIPEEILRQLRELQPELVEVTQAQMDAIVMASSLRHNTTINRSNEGYRGASWNEVSPGVQTMSQDIEADMEIIQNVQANDPS